MHVPRQVCAREWEQRPDQGAGHRFHSGQTCRSRSRQHAHEDGLGLVVGMVAEEDSGGIRPQAGRFEKRVSRFAGRGLRRVRTERSSPLLAGEPEMPRQLTDSSGHHRALGMDAVVEVRNAKIEAMQIGRACQKVEQGDGVRAAGHCNECPTSRERERSEVLSE